MVVSNNAEGKRDQEINNCPRDGIDTTTRACRGSEQGNGVRQSI